MPFGRGPAGCGAAANNEGSKGEDERERKKEVDIDLGREEDEGGGKAERKADRIGFGRDQSLEEEEEIEDEERSEEEDGVEREGSRRREEGGSPVVATGTEPTVSVLLTRGFCRQDLESPLASFPLLLKISVSSTIRRRSGGSDWRPTFTSVCCRLEDSLEVKDLDSGSFHFGTCQTGKTGTSECRPLNRIPGPVA